MSNFRIGGFTSNNRFAQAQGVHTGIIVPQVLFMGQEPSKARLQTSALNRRLSNSRVISESFKEMSLANSEVNLGSRARQTVRDKVYDVDLTGLVTLINKKDTLARLNRIPNLSRLLSGNFVEKNIDDSENKKWIDEISNPFLQFDIVYFLRLPFGSGSQFAHKLLVINNISFKLLQSFRATHKNNPRAKTSDKIFNLNTRLAISNNQGSPSESRGILFNRNYDLSYSNYFLLQDGSFKIETRSAGFSFDNQDNAYKLETPFSVSNENYYNRLLRTYRTGSQQYPGRGILKILNKNIDVQVQTINEAYILPSRRFLDDYINLIFLVLIEELSSDISNFESKQYIVYDLLLGAIYYAIRNGDVFFNGLEVQVNNLFYARQSGSAGNFVWTNDDDENLNDKLLRRFDRSDSLQISYNAYPRKHLVNSAQFKRISSQLSDLYTEILQKEYVKELLSLIIKSVTYVRKLSSDEFRTSQDDDRIAISLKRDLFNL